MPIIGMAGTKGGTGKSTLGIGLAAELVARGLRVQLVDGDERQRTASKWRDVAAEHGQPAVHTVCIGAALPAQLPVIARSKDHELVIVDLPCRLEERTAQVLRHVDLVLVPCGPSAPELWELTTTLDQIRDVQRTRKALKAGIVINSKPARTVLAREARRILTTDPELVARGIPVLESEFHRLTPHAYAWARGLGVTVYDPTSAAARETRALADEVCKLLGLRRGRKGKR